MVLVEGFESVVDVCEYFFEVFSYAFLEFFAGLGADGDLFVGGCYEVFCYFEWDGSACAALSTSAMLLICLNVRSATAVKLRSMRTSSTCLVARGQTDDRNVSS